VTETPEAVILTPAEGADPAQYRVGLDRSVALGVPLVVQPPPTADRPLTPAEASDHGKYMAALARGEVKVVEPPVAGDKNVYLSKAEASDHATWKAADERARQKGGVVVVLKT